jgi:di/tricarboxylate transporter
MPSDASLVIGVVSAVVLLMALTRIAPDLILMAALAALMLCGILTAEEALTGFANTGVMTIAALYVVSAGLRETGAIRLGASLLGMPKTSRDAQLRLMAPVSLLSAFLNNTAVVSMFIPAVQEWCQRLKMSPSKLLLPLSYTAMLGGTCTLIGTSTNLVVDGLLQKQYGISLSLFELAWVGIPILLVGSVYLMLFADKLLPVRVGPIEQLEQAREYCVAVRIPSQSPLIGKTVAEAGLRNLAYAYLAEIERAERLLTAVSPDTLLLENDCLFFIGAPECALELRNIRGLTPAAGNVGKLDIASHQRCLIEVVLGPDFPGLGQTIRECQFRTRYQAVILSVGRQGQRLPGKLGDIVLKVGDTLLVEASKVFVEQYRCRRDFLLVSALNDSTPVDYSKSPRAIAILVCMVVLSASEVLSILEAALLAAGAMIATRCVTASHARRSVDLSVLVVIAASFALGTAMLRTGAAGAIVDSLIGDGALSSWLLLALIYLLTTAFTEVISNNAAAVLMFPIASAVAEQQGLNVLPFALAIMFAASASFMTPLGYQTNLMVYGPGGYHARDYLRVGLPLNIVVGMTAVWLIPVVWPF